MKKIVVYNIDGRKISVEEYRNKNQRALADYLNGKFKTSEELKNKFKI